uniref:Uncharacterized protein n=1 Tax=Oryza meridionalis TaxID=40149 RepID=A0A0E0E1B5_9ORYZ
MAAVAVKRKLIVDKSPTLHLLHSPPSPITLLRRRVLPSDLESSEGSSTSLRSDAAYTATIEEDVQAVARAVIRIALKFPETICQLVHQLTLGNVAAALDWDLLDTDHPILERILLLTVYPIPCLLGAHHIPCP